MITSASSHLFVLQLWEGRYFPFDHQRLFCVASFNGESQQTGLSDGTPSAPSWSTTLEWQLSAAQLRSLQAAGSNHCKVTFAREDGRRVGWVVCDLRTAKLHAKHPRKPAWWALAGPFKGKDSPEVLLHFSLVEQRPVPQQHQHQLPSNAPRVISPGMAAAAVASPTAAGRLYASQLAGPGAPGGTSVSTAQQALPGLASLQQLQTPVLKQLASQEPQPDGPSARGVDPQLLQQAGTLSEAIAADGSLRRFDFGIDLREFQAGRRLPLNLASVVVQLSFPQAFAGLILQSNGRLPPRLAPLRTQPPVDVSRGSEAALPGGQASVQFTAGLMSLATLLASNPVMVAEVWHKERLAEDCLLGRAHIPLSPLLQESWVDGRAGVFAMMPVAAAGEGQQEVERVQIGTLHLVMSLEEVGPAQEALQQRPPSHAPSPRQTSPRKPPPHLQPSLLGSNLPTQPPRPEAIPLQRQQHDMEQQGREQPPCQMPVWADAQQQRLQQQQQQEHEPPRAQSRLGNVQQQGQDGHLSPVRETAAEVAAQVVLLPTAAPPAVQRLAPVMAAGTPAADSNTNVGSGSIHKPAPLPALPGTAPGHAGAPESTQQLAQQPASEDVGLAGAEQAYACMQPQQGPLAALPPQPPSTGFPSAPDNAAKTAASASALSAEPAAPGSRGSALTAAGSSNADMNGGATFDMPVAAVAGQPSMLQALAPDIEASWQLEVWKRQEQERWKAELKQREGERMAALEAEWRRREKHRETEHAALRQEYTSMQSRTQQVLTAAEEREKKVAAAEEGVARRRKELEREHAARLAEAKATVRRLQMEFEHQLELEHLKTRQLQQQAAAAEGKGIAAEEKAAAAERALQECKEAHARSPVGLLQQELGQARAALAEAQQRAAQAGEAKRKYKEQVVRLAQEVSALQRHLAEVVGLRRDQLESEVVKLAAQEAALAARREAGQLGALRQELRALQQGGSNGGGGKEAVASHDPALLLGRGAGSEQVQRLLQEREELLGSGAYARDDPLIHQLDTRIRECAATAAAAPEAGLVE